MDNSLDSKANRLVQPVRRALMPIRLVYLPVYYVKLEGRSLLMVLVPVMIVWQVLYKLPMDKLLVLPVFLVHGCPPLDKVNVLLVQQDLIVIVVHNSNAKAV